MNNGNGITREAENPYASFKNRLNSFGALLEDGLLQDLSDEVFERFKTDGHLLYDKLEKEEQELYKAIIDAYKPTSRFDDLCIGRYSR